MARSEWTPRDPPKMGPPNGQVNYPCLTGLPLHCNNCNNRYLLNPFNSIILIFSKPAGTSYIWVQEWSDSFFFVPSSNSIRGCLCNPQLCHSLDAIPPRSSEKSMNNYEQFPWRKIRKGQSVKTISTNCELEPIMVLHLNGFEIKN